MKYKIKRRRKVFKTWYILLILIVILVVISTSYALWSATLYINGTVTGTASVNMPVILVPQSGTDQYVVTDFAQNVAVIESQYIENNVLVVNYATSNTQGTPRTTNITINFQNGYSEIIENGTTTYEITGDSAFFNNQPTITTTSSVNPGETGTVSINMKRLRFNSLVTSTTCQIKVTYQLGDQTIEFYIQLNFKK